MEQCEHDFRVRIWEFLDESILRVVGCTQIVDKDS